VSRQGVKLAVLFDVDGTLIDHDHAQGASSASVHRKLGLPGTVEAFQASWHEALERYYARFLSGELSSQEQRRARLRELVDPALSDAAADDLILGYLEVYLSHCRLYPEVEWVLGQLSAYPLGIISNGELAQQQAKLARNGIAHHFVTLVMSAECGIAKPAPAIFHLACSRMGVHPSRAVYVGDRRDIDAEAALAAGLHAVWVDRHGRAAADDPLPRVRSLSELPALLATIDG